MRKILHVSHKQDMDGKVAPMLTKLLNPACEVEVLLLSNKDMNTGVVNEINGILEVMRMGDVAYDEIIITDLGINAEAFDIVAGAANYIPISFYDHHIDSIKNAKRYDGYGWIHVDHTVSATFIYAIEMAYKLRINTHISTERYHEIIKNVSDYDTFEFKDNNNFNAERLNILLNIAGDDVFEQCLCDYLTGKSALMGLEKDLALVDYIINDRQRYIDYIEKTAKVVRIYGRKCVVAFTDRFDYVSELGYQLCLNHQEIDLLMAVNPTNTNVQLRARKPSAMLYEFAQAFGGGGHEFAAGFPFAMDIYINILNSWKESEEYLVTR